MPRHGPIVMRIALILLAAALAAVTACTGDGDRPENWIEVPAAEPLEDIVRRAARVCPTPRQLAWQRLEFQAFVHFGINTFTDREWGDGSEDPGLFEPREFDADQWIRVFRDAGMRGVILTAKHHDGFCLWPSRYTEHSVKNSPWKEGKGDVVREVAEACGRGGLEFGIYLSPWDRHEPSYGDSPRYNRHFKNLLQELLTGYGPVSEVWFDGACGEGPNGKRQVYDWTGYYALVRRLQPDAVISIRGPDVRWCGNEAGRTRPSEWSVVPLAADPFRHDWPDMTAEDLGSRAKLVNAAFLAWYPAQVNTSIRPGWFYHPGEDERVKPAEQLRDIYLSSVGGNAQFLLNIPPDPRGLIHDNDAARLRELGRRLHADFARNLAEGAVATASSVRLEGRAFSPQNMLDGDTSTYWTTEPETESADLIFELARAATFNCAALQEAIEVGQRIEAFTLEVWEGSGWREAARATVVGYKRLLRFDSATARRVRLKIRASRLSPTLAEFGLYRLSSHPLCSPSFVVLFARFPSISGA